MYLLSIICWMDTIFCYWIRLLWIKYWPRDSINCVFLENLLSDIIGFRIKMLSWLSTSLIHPLIWTFSKINTNRWPKTVNGHILFRSGAKIFHVFCWLFNYSSANRHALAQIWRNGNCPWFHSSQLLQNFTSVYIYLPPCTTHVQLHVWTMNYRAVQVNIT